MALVADRHGEVIGAPFKFALTISGRDQLVSQVSAADRVVGGALHVRVGIEAAGCYHRVLATSLHAECLDVVELNPHAVKVARTQLGGSRLKTDVRDCLAMVELPVRGQGWPLYRKEGPVAEQVQWVAQRRRKADALQALGNQIHALADVAPPGLTDWFPVRVRRQSARLLLVTVADPSVVAGFSVDGLVGLAREHQVRMLRPKAAEVIADERLAELLPATPATVLTSIPGVVAGSPVLTAAREHLEHAVGDHEAAHDVDGGQNHGNKAEDEADRRLRLAGHDDRADEDDAVNRVGTTHQRGVQSR